MNAKLIDENQGLHQSVETSESGDLQIASGEALIAKVLVEKHPVLDGRILVSGNDAGGKHFELWLPTMQGLDIKSSDTVLIQRPGNADEPLVTGIVQSAHHSRKTHNTAHSFTLNENEALTINDHHGRALLDISAGEKGPSVVLHAALAELDVDGSLRMEADSLEFKARQGEMSLSASGDIKVDGEMIKLN